MEIECYTRNPLLHRLVIHQSLGYLDFRTLKICRLVCKLWEHEVNKLLKIKKDPLEISKGKFIYPIQYENFNFILVRSDIGPNFFELTKKLISQIQDYSYNVKYLELQNAGWTLAQLQKILTLLPRLEELNLSTDFVLPKVDHSNKITSVIIHNLKSLYLNLRDDNLQNLVNVEFLFKLYAMAPNLQEIKCWTDLFSETQSRYTTIFSNLFYRSVVQSSLIGNKCRNINYLDINMDLKNEDIDLLIGANLPLKTLHIPINIMTLTEKVESLLRSLRDTLKRLKISYQNCIRTTPSFCYMTNLEYLAFHGWYSKSDGKPGSTYSLDVSSFNVLFYPVSPLSFFPCYFQNFTSSLTSLKEIQLNSVYYIPKDVFNFKILFPNLRAVKVSYLNDEMLRSILENFTQLEKLVVTDGKFSDWGITGISPIVQELLQNNVMNECTSDVLREFPSISSLKSLKTLELSSPNVTDYGVINGVSLCLSVKELTLNFPRMTDSSLRKIAERLLPDSLNIKLGSFSDEIINLVKSRIKGRGTFRLFLIKQL